MSWNLLPGLRDKRLVDILPEFRKGSGFVFVEYDFEVKKNYAFSLSGIKNIIPYGDIEVDCKENERVYFYSFNGGSPFLFPVDYFEGMCICDNNNVVFKPCRVNYSWRGQKDENYLSIHFDYKFDYKEVFFITFLFLINKSFEIKSSIFIEDDGEWVGCVHFLDFFYKKTKVSIRDSAYLFGWKGLFK